MLKYIQHHGHMIIFRKKPASQIPYCKVCKRDLTAEEIKEIKG